MSEKKSDDKERIFMPELFSMTPEPHLIAGHCNQCGFYTFPKYLACPNCFSDDIGNAPLSPTGNLHSFTVVRRSMPDYPVPYALGLVDFPEGVRVMAQIETDNFDSLKLDTKMGITVGTIRKGKDGGDIKSYKFCSVS